MNMEDRIYAIEEAQEKLQEGLDMLKNALRGLPSERYYESYILAHLDIWINGGNSHYLTGDTGIPEIIEQIRKEEKERKEDEEE
jgi:hypothetical protein